jgi:hypothetical protein
MSIDIDIDITAATRFVTTHARLLDRHRLRLLLGEPAGPAVLRAVDAYRNDDGGYGWGLEPDFRAPESQPAGALHAFEAFAEVAPLRTDRAVELCDWLASVSFPDGGMPFGLPVADPTGCAPFWADADHTASSLHITAAVTATARRVARHDPAVAAHPWLAGATRYCLDAIAAAELPLHALMLKFSLDFLDTVADDDSEAAAQLARLGAQIPPEGRLHVEGGVEDEFMRPLDFAPEPGRPVRGLFAGDVVAAELERLASRQQDDGGWPEEFTAYSPMAALEWRGYLTVHAVRVLTASS